MRRAWRDRSDKERKLAYTVRRNAVDFNGIEWARAATKHRISRARSAYVIQRAGCYWEQEAPLGHPQADARLLFFGDDASGISLKVICVEREDGRLVVIHAMPVRSRYWEYYEEAGRWQGKSDIR